VIMSPLIKPTSVQAAKAKIVLSRSGRLNSSQNILASTPESAATEPTEISTPPEIITKVMPIAVMPTTASVLARLPRLLKVKKNSVCVMKKIHMTTKLTTKLSVVTVSARKRGRLLVGVMVAFKINPFEKIYSP
jgi:hypothetical protein